MIPKNHPRAESLRIRELLVSGYEGGLVAKEGLIAHGRGEMFDYIIGEKTTRSAKSAIKAAAHSLVTADRPVLSVNGNFAALCPKEIIQLGKIIGAKIEVNLFYHTEKRSKIIQRTLEKYGGKNILTNHSNAKEIPTLSSPRGRVNADGIHKADVVLVPLEDGDRTESLISMGKIVITFDLNPLSRTARMASICIVDNITRGMILLIKECRRIKRDKDMSGVRFDKDKNRRASISQIMNHLGRQV